MKQVFGKLHSIETFGAVDGPGIRTVFFLQGCPARCLYCHNPDTWKPCGGREVTVDEIVRTAERGRPYYGANGGVTFSGGEPLMQGKFLLEAIRALHARGIHVCIDTSGTWIDDYTEDVIAECDMLLLDIKHSDKDRFREVCGCSIISLYRVISMANKYRKPVWIRQVVVPGINDTEDNAEELAAFIRRYIRNLYHAELLGYHTMALNKYKDLGMKYRLEGVPPMDAQKLRGLNALLQKDLQLIAARRGA